MTEPRTYPLNEALKALDALRGAAGLAPEQFPVQAFVGMISDEVETLRTQGRSDEEIAQLIQQHSNIQITADEINRYYASPEQRHQHGG